MMPGREELGTAHETALLICQLHRELEQITGGGIMLAIAASSLAEPLRAAFKLTGDSIPPGAVAAYLAGIQETDPAQVVAIYAQANNLLVTMETIRAAERVHIRLDRPGPDRPAG